MSPARCIIVEIVSNKNWAERDPSNLKLTSINFSFKKERKREFQLNVESRHWLIHGFLARVPGPDIPGFLLQPFRKPKRIRTAFSPSQLLKLEHAFEKNHYVVGAERKQLAQALSLTETQVTSSAYSIESTLCAPYFRRTVLVSILY